MKVEIKKFRSALLLAINTFDNVPLDLKDFPKGACEVSSVMLMTYLYSCGYSNISYFSGVRFPSDGGQEESHTFLKYKNFFIDITGSQFDDCKDEIIFEADHQLHKSFKGKDRGESDIYKYSDQGKVSYQPFYEKTIELLNT